MRSSFVLGLCLLGSACRHEGNDAPSVPKQCAEADQRAGIVRPEGWAPLSHCRFRPADVGKVFPIDVVGKMVISMTAAEYAAMQADLASHLVNEDDDGSTAACAGLTENAVCSTADYQGSCFFEGGNLACLPDDEMGLIESKNPCSGKANGDACTQGTRAGVCTKTTRLLVCQADGFDPADLSGEYDDGSTPKPAYFHADVEFAGARWKSVGIRYKGNNSLDTVKGEKKPLRLKLDEWEKENKAVTDQRFFGFQVLSLSPNQTDPTNLHQVLAAEAFREAGVPGPYASFVEVYLDSGSGSRLLGLYAMSEFPDDQLPQRVFGEDEGNMYKPVGV